MSTKAYLIADEDMPAILGGLRRWAADIRDHGADAADVKPGALEQIERLRADLSRQRDAGLREGSPGLTRVHAMAAYKAGGGPAELEASNRYRINPNTHLDIEVLVDGAWEHLFRAPTREYAAAWMAPAKAY